MNLSSRKFLSATGLSVLLSNPCALAQTIQASMLPTATIPLTLREGAQIDTAANGAGATWMMTNSGWYSLWGSSFGSAAGAYHSDLYPSADQVFRFQPYGTSSIPHHFFDSSNGGLDQVGFSVDPAYDTTYTPVKRILSFPMDLGGTCSYQELDYMGDPVTVTWTYAGHGTLTGTPVGDIPNVAKVRSSNGRLMLWNTSPLHPLLMAGPGFYDFDVFMPSTTAIDGAESILPPKLSPNPSTGQFSVVCGSCTAIEHLTIHNATGQLLQDLRPAQSDRLTLDLSNEANGLYTVRITQGEEHTMLQVMVQH